VCAEQKNIQTRARDWPLGCTRQQQAVGERIKYALGPPDLRILFFFPHTTSTTLINLIYREDSYQIILVFHSLAQLCCKIIREMQKDQQQP